MPIGKSFFAVNLPNLFRAIQFQMLTLVFQCMKILKSLFIHYLVRIWITCWWNLNKIVWSKIYKILSFLTNTRIFKPCFDKALIVWCHFGNFTIVLLTFRLLSFSVPKINKTYWIRLVLTLVLQRGRGSGCNPPVIFPRQLF